MNLKNFFYYCSGYLNIRMGNMVSRENTEFFTVSSDDDQIVAHIDSAIKNAELESVPTENFFTTEALPMSLYRELLFKLPSDDVMDYLPHRDIVREDGTSTRKYLSLTDDVIFRFPIKDQVFWTRCLRILTDDRISKSLIKKFSKALSKNFPYGIPDMAAIPMLYRDYPGYHITPHPDAEYKIMTMQFYLPEDLTQTHLGTTFHTRSVNGFEELKTNLFLPNSAYGFVRTNESWHSVKQIAASEKIRNSIALTYYVKGSEYLNPPR